MWVGTDVEVREWWKDWKWLREQVREQQPRGVVRVGVCVWGVVGMGRGGSFEGDAGRRKCQGHNNPGW